MCIINCENVLIYQEQQLINVHEWSLQVVPGKWYHVLNSTGVCEYPQVLWVHLLQTGMAKWTWLWPCTPANATNLKSIPSATYAYIFPTGPGTNLPLKLGVIISMQQRRLCYYFTLYQDEEEHTIHDNTWDTWHGYDRVGQILNWAPCKLCTCAPTAGQVLSCDVALDWPFSYTTPHTLPFCFASSSSKISPYNCCSDGHMQATSPKHNSQSNSSGRPFQKTVCTDDRSKVWKMPKKLQCRAL